LEKARLIRMDRRGRRLVFQSLHDASAE
jgi:hypothetical protein